MWRPWFHVPPTPSFSRLVTQTDFHGPVGLHPQQVPISPLRHIFDNSLLPKLRFAQANAPAELLLARGRKRQEGISRSRSAPISGSFGTVGFL